jgi:hypothetical protein
LICKSRWRRRDRAAESADDERPLAAGRAGSTISVLLAPHWVVAALLSVPAAPAVEEDAGARVGGERVEDQDAAGRAGREDEVAAELAGHRVDRRQRTAG